jgi:predicted DsbA family dithiol-disulfide isomerase
MSGLIPDWKTFNDPVNNVSRPVQMGPVWMQAAHMSGMPVNPNIWINDPPVSSYFACMAVKAAALQSPRAGSTYLRALREAIMLNSINISKAGALLKIAETVAHEQPDVLNYTIFKKDLAEDHAKKAFERDIAEVRMRNISRCPTLLFRYQGENGMAISGYHSYNALLKVLQQAAPSVTKLRKIESRENYINYWKTLTDRELEEIQVDCS